MPRLAPVTSTVLPSMVMSVPPALRCSCGFRAACTAAHSYRPAGFRGVAAGQLVTFGFSWRWWGPGTVFPRQAERPEQSRVLEGDDPRDPRNGDRRHQIADTLVGAFAHHY